MDLWDVVKLIVRRWIVSVPLLLLTVAALVWTASEVTPNYTAEGNILMLPPTTEINSSEGEERAVNPWDTDSLTGAVITLLRNKRLHDQLTGEGYDATWEAGRDVQFFSVINIEVTSRTAEQAQATIQRLSEVVAHEVSARQQGYALTEGQMVATVTLGGGENVEIARGNQLRAIIVVFFAGMILTVGLTIGYDAMLRSRDGRHAHPALVAARASTGASTEPAPGLATAGARQTNGVRMEPSRPTAATESGNHAHQGRQAGINVSYRPAAGAPGGRAGDEPPRPAPPVDDSTVVLPLSSLTPGSDHDDEDSGGGGAEPRWR